MARAAAKPKTTAPKPSAKPHAAKPTIADIEAHMDEHGAGSVSLDPDGEVHFDPDASDEAQPTVEMEEVEPKPDPYTGPISPTPAHLIRMTHPTGGTSDGFATDESGAILVPVAQVGAMKGHGFVVDHLPQPEASDAEVI